MKSTVIMEWAKGREGGKQLLDVLGVHKGDAGNGDFEKVNYFYGPRVTPEQFRCRAGKMWCVGKNGSQRRVLLTQSNVTGVVRKACWVGPSAKPSGCWAASRLPLQSM